MRVSAKLQRSLFEAGAVVTKTARLPEAIIEPAEILTDAVELPLPPSTNNLFVTVGKYRVPSGDYKAWRKEVAPILARFKPPVPLPFGVTITLIGGTGLNEARDLGNCEKAVTDALVDAGVIRCDSLRHGLHRIVMQYRPGSIQRACVEVRIVDGTEPLSVPR